MRKFETYINQISNNADEKEIVRFGLIQLLTLLSGVVVITILGFIFGIPSKVFLFLAFALPLRQNAGGYHTKSRWSCLFISIIILFIVLLILKYFNPGIITSIVLYAVGSLLILTLAPIGNVNRELDNLEKEIYEERTILIWIVESLLFVILELLKQLTWGFMVCLTIFLCGLLVLIEYLRERVLT